MSWRWDRLAVATATACVGIGAGYAGLTANLGPLAVMACGVLGLAGIAATAFLLIFIYAWIEDDVRPSLCFRRPAVPIALMHSGAAMKGYRTFRNHPVRFWGGLMLNNSFFFGFMLFGKPEYESLRLASVGRNPKGGDECNIGSVEDEHAVPEGQTPESGIPSNMIGEAIEALDAADLALRVCLPVAPKPLKAATTLRGKSVFEIAENARSKARATLSKLRGEG